MLDASRSVGGEPQEIACDESGFSGGNLVGIGHSPVFAHASVHLDRAAAADLVATVRARIAAKDGEYKAVELLRSRHGGLVPWFLGPSSPLAGRAQVHLTDTRFFVLARLVDALLGPRPVSGTQRPGEEPSTRPKALLLYRSGERGYGPLRWPQFLRPGANLLRTNNRWLPAEPVPAFFAAVAGMAAEGPPDLRDLMAELGGARTVAERVRAELLTNPKRAPLLEPLIPALRSAIEFWLGSSTRLLIVHDEQSAITPERIAEIAGQLPLRSPGGGFAGVRRVDSTEDPRVQVADYLAGIARRLAGDHLAGGADPARTGLLRPLVHPTSIWPVGWPW
jgi:hypothetical protein